MHGSGKEAGKEGKMEKVRGRESVMEVEKEIMEVRGMKEGKRRRKRRRGEECACG